MVEYLHSGNPDATNPPRQLVVATSVIIIRSAMASNEYFFI